VSIPLLSTKICVPPPRPNLVPRPRLIGRLDEGVRLGHRLALVSAPAGSGKTTLVTAWLHGTPGVAWLSLDKEDDQPLRFLTYLVAALQQVDGNIGQGVQSLLTGSGRLPIEMLVTTLINDVATAFESPLPPGEDLALEGGAACSGQGGAGRRLVLVLDDYQVIDAPDIHGAVAFLLDHLPQGMHLVIVTREDPPLLLSRWRARGLMTEIRERDLRFSEPEVTAFLTGVMGLDLMPDEVSALKARTEGWVAGLQLAAISMRGHSDPGGFVRSFTGSHRHILDYLTDEVLRQQSKELRSFLFQTCILSRLSGPLCDAVTGREDRQGVLEHLEHANLFVIPLDDQRQWYRYHHLFGELLQYHLKRREGAEVLMRLHRRAGKWLARHGFEAEALQHAIAGQDFDRAAGLIESVAVDTIVGGGATSLQRWIDALPQDVVRGRSLLCVIHAWTLNLTEQVEAIEPRLQDAERALESRGPRR
jgi:LuxR family maltose regulon positive regulatory protein